LMPKIDLSCSDRVDQDDLKWLGDRGSIFVAECPKHCLDEIGFVHGTGVYSAKSSICRAAIHAGVISNNGGLIVIVKGPTVEFFQGTSQRGIVSTESKISELSFGVSTPTSHILDLAQNFD